MLTTGVTRKFVRELTRRWRPRGFFSRRVVERRPSFGPEDKEKFRTFMRMYEKTAEGL